MPATLERPRGARGGVAGALATAALASMVSVWHTLPTERDLIEREVLGLAPCLRLLRITGQAHVPATMAQRLPRAVVVMLTRAELPQHILGRIKRGHMCVRHKHGHSCALWLGRFPVRQSKGIV